jgi:hypothetical protein
MSENNLNPEENPRQKAKEIVPETDSGQDHALKSNRIAICLTSTAEESQQKNKGDLNNAGADKDKKLIVKIYSLRSNSQRLKTAEKKPSVCTTQKKV